MLVQKINEALVKSMKDSKPEVKNLLKVIKADIQRAEQGPKGRVEVDDKEVIRILKKTLEGLEMTNGSDVEKELVKSFLPKQLTTQEIEAIIDEMIIKFGFVDKKSMGKLIGLFNKQYMGQSDGKVVAEIVSSKLP